MNLKSRTPFISVCIPTYNRSRYLKRCIESVIGCSHSQIEIIISDNASPDNTEEIVRRFSDQRIRYIKNEQNIGPLNNIANLISLADGEYIFFLTDDDYLLPGGLDIVDEFLSNHKVDGLKTDLLVYLEQTNRSYNYTSFSHSLVCGSKDYLAQSKIWLASHVLTGCCFKRSSIPPNFKQLPFTWYSPMLLLGIMNDKLGYIAKPVAVHTWENELFWGVNYEDSTRKLLDSKIDVLFILKSMGKSEEQITIYAQSLAEDLFREFNFDITKIPGRLLEFAGKEFSSRLKNKYEHIIKTRRQQQIKKKIKTVVRKLLLMD